MKSFKEFLREEDAKAPTTTTAKGDKPLSFEIPPGYPGTYQQGPPAPKRNYGYPVPRGPRFFPEQFDTLEDYIREFDNWFLEQYGSGAFEGWSEKEINEWYKKTRKEIERIWENHIQPREPDPPIYA